MLGLGLHARARRPRAVDVALTLAAGAYLAALAGAITGHVDGRVGWALLPVPVVVAVVLVLRRRSLSSAGGMAVGATLLGSVAVVTGLVLLVNWMLVAAVPLLAAAAVACARFPAVAVLGVLLLTGTFGSLQAFFGFSAPRLIDLLLGGLWLAAFWSWTIRGRTREGGLRLWAGPIALAAYVLFTAGAIVAAENGTAALQSFRASVWYLATVLLIAVAPWSERARTAALRAAVVIGLGVGGYAVFRWVIGPAGAERELAEASLNNFLGETLRPVGSFYTAKELAAWTAMAIPFLVGLALAWRGRWRVLAAGAAAACVLGMLAADVRAGPAAAVPGVVVVLVLFQVSQAFRGRRGPVVAIALLATVVGGAGAYSITVGDDPGAGDRYAAILDPADDPSYQGRLIKWRAALDDIDRAPFGHGLGTSGRAQKRYGDVSNVGSIDVDNSYLKVAYEQGFIVMVAFAGALMLLLVGLARRAFTTLDPARAGPAIAACGTLVAMLVLFAVGTYVEGLPALAGWVLVGLGVSRFTTRASAGGAPEALEPSASRRSPRRAAGDTSLAARPARAPA